MNDVEEIKSKLDIAEVIAGYIELKPAGRNLKALSPFKQEKTPSFMVSPEKGIWHDFSSGEGGDVISFVMKMEGISFPEALEMLAKRAGVTLTRRSSGPGGQTRQRSYDAIDAAVAYYHVSLSRNASARDYLTKQRGLKPETIRTFLLGYAPDSWDGLTKYLLKKGFTLAELKSAGLTAQKAGRTTGYDVFRGRIMFPIYDTQGRAIGFSGRILHDDGSAAKYINTGNTPIYNKSTAIYGLKQAKEGIRQANEALLVEGNMDAVGLHQAGITNTVAVSGTALTSQQLKSLSYLADTILICFDNDVAGLNATKRAIELGAELGLQLKVISLPSGKDPDELVRKQPAEFKKAYQKAEAGLDYLFDRARSQFPVVTGPGKKQFSDYLIPVIAKLVDSVEQDHYIKKLAQALDVNESSVRDKLTRTSRVNRTPPPAPPPEEPIEAAALTPAQTKQIALENALLELILAYPDTRDSLVDLDDALVSVTNQPVFNALRQNPSANLAKLSSVLPNESNRVKILSLRGEETYSDLSEHDRRLEAYTQVHHLREMQLKLARTALSRQLAEAEARGDTKKRDSLLAQIQTTINEDL